MVTFSTVLKQDKNVLIGLWN